MSDTGIELSFAPWTSQQVTSLNDFQLSGVFHPFTCPNRAEGHVRDGELVATPLGWTCPSCAYHQDWAHPAMVDGSWRRWQTWVAPDA